MKTPFKNDPFALVWIAFKRLYPDKECECMWNPDVKTDEDGNEVFGVTQFTDKGIFVSVTPEISVRDSIEVLAHELAHVAVGYECEHEEEWEDAFEAIFNEYMVVGDEMLPDMSFEEE